MAPTSCALQLLLCPVDLMNVLPCSGAAKEGEAAEAEATAEGGGPLVTEADIANIVAQWTGIPVEKVLWPSPFSWLWS